MIFDSVSGFERYLSLHSGFTAAYTFMRRADFMRLEPGYYPIRGTEVYCKIIESDGRSYEEARLEVHDSHIDIQVVLEGTEIYGWKDRAACSQLSGEYDAERDLAFYADAPICFLSATPGQAAVFFPHDAHAPLIGEGRIKKALIKVRL